MKYRGQTNFNNKTFNVYSNKGIFYFLEKVEDKLEYVQIDDFVELYYRYNIRKLFVTQVKPMSHHDTEETRIDYLEPDLKEDHIPCVIGNDGKKINIAKWVKALPIALLAMTLTGCGTNHEASTSQARNTLKEIMLDNVQQNENITGLEISTSILRDGEKYIATAINSKSKLADWLGINTQTLDDAIKSVEENDYLDENEKKIAISTLKDLYWDTEGKFDYTVAALNAKNLKTEYVKEEKIEEVGGKDAGAYYTPTENIITLPGEKEKADRNMPHELKHCYGDYYLSTEDEEFPGYSANAFIIDDDSYIEMGQGTMEAINEIYSEMNRNSTGQFIITNSNEEGNLDVAGYTPVMTVEQMTEMLVPGYNIIDVWNNNVLVKIEKLIEFGFSEEEAIRYLMISDEMVTLLAEGHRQEAYNLCEDAMDILIEKYLDYQLKEEKSPMDSIYNVYAAFNSTYFSQKMSIAYSDSAKERYDNLFEFIKLKAIDYMEEKGYEFTEEEQILMNTFNIIICWDENGLYHSVEPHKGFTGTDGNFYGVSKDYEIVPVENAYMSFYEFYKFCTKELGIVNLFSIDEEGEKLVLDPDINYSTKPGVSEMGKERIISLINPFDGIYHNQSKLETILKKHEEFYKYSNFDISLYDPIMGETNEAVMSFDKTGNYYGTYTKEGLLMPESKIYGGLTSDLKKEGVIANKFFGFSEKMNVEEFEEYLNSNGYLKESSITPEDLLEATEDLSMTEVEKGGNIFSRVKNWIARHLPFGETERD